MYVKKHMQRADEHSVSICSSTESDGDSEEVVSMTIMLRQVLREAGARISNTLRLPLVESTTTPRVTRKRKRSQESWARNLARKVQ